MKKAFTLTEILISMTIIGVVAMLMVPVMQNTQTKSLETATAHFHSMMSQAIKHYMADHQAETIEETPIAYKSIYNLDNHTYNENGRSDAIKETENFIYKYLQVAKVCSEDDYSQCFSKTVRSMSGLKGDFVPLGKMVGTDEKYKSFILSNGVVVRVKPARCHFDNRTSIITHTQTSSKYFEPMGIQVDINGKKGPNTAGRDLWFMFVYNDGVLSEKIHGYTTMENYLDRLSEYNEEMNEDIKYRFEACYGAKNRTPYWQYGGGCFARFENNGFKFDY